MLFPALLARPAESVITTFSYQSLGMQLAALGFDSPTATAWPAANTVIFVPFWVPEPFLATKMFWGVGVAAGNVDCGIYATDGTRLVSAGSTVVAGAVVTQSADITDTLLARGTYYMALVADTVTTLTLYGRVVTAGISQALGFLQQASVTLPLSTNANPATFAKFTQGTIPFIGVIGYGPISR